MNTRKSLIVSGIVMLAVLIALTLFTQLSQAQGPGPERSAQPQDEAGVAAVAPGAIPIQGRLTNASGSPLSGTYSIMFRLYETDLGGTAVCTDTRSVSVVSGLFSDYMDGCYNDITGQKLWLGVKVESDAEMTPRQVIYPVPYALSLVPGAVISTAGYPALHVESTSPSGRALRAYASATSGTNYGVVGASKSPNGYGGYFYNDDNGTGLYGRGSPGVLGENSGFGNGIVGRAGVLGAGVKGEGNDLGLGGWFTNTSGIALRAESDGAALQLGGSGRIESTADSYIFVPGSALVREEEDNTTRWFMQANGAALVWRGATAGNKYIHIPIILPGVLYGENVTIKSVTIYYLCENGANNFITATDLHKQTDADSFVVLASETTDRTSNTATSYTLTPTSGNLLSSDQGILMLRLYLNFANDTEFIRIGGVRVQLGHQ
jgi:hypothetical protein